MKMMNLTFDTRLLFTIRITSIASTKNIIMTTFDLVTISSEPGQKMNLENSDSKSSLKPIAKLGTVEPSPKSQTTEFVLKTSQAVRTKDA